MRLHPSLLAAALLLAPVALRATPISYTFTYTGTGTYTAGETASGQGSFTVNASPGTASTLTAFSFTDTLTSGAASSTYTYGLGNITSQSFVYGGTTANPTLATFSFGTAYVAGTNAAFGNVNFNGAYSGASSGSTSTNPTVLLGITNGSLTVSQSVQPALSAAPEPSSLALLGTGLLGALGIARRKLAA